MTATDDAVSLSPDLELELFGPYSENTEKYQTERELVESLNVRRIPTSHQFFEPTVGLVLRTYGLKLTKEIRTQMKRQS